MTDMFRLVLLVSIMLLTGPAVWAGESCRLSDLTHCDSSQSFRDVHPEDQACFVQQPDFIKIGYLSCQTGLSTAWEYLHVNPNYQEPDPVAAVDVLNYRALKYNRTENEALLALLVRHGLDRPRLGQLFAASIEWAETEKRKSAEELYERALRAAQDIKHPPLKEDFRTLFLMMAAEKGHALAEPALHRVPPPQECRDQPTFNDSLYCLDKGGGYISDAFHALSTGPAITAGAVVYPEPDCEAVRWFLRLQALMFSQTENKHKIAVMKTLNIETPCLISLYEDSIEWAEAEKTKHPFLLYNLSRFSRFDFVEPAHLRDSYKDEYYRLALARGSFRARLEEMGANIAFTVKFWGKLLKAMMSANNSGTED